MYQFLNGFEDELGLEPQVNGGDATRNGLLDIVTKIAGGAKRNKRAPVQTANEGFGNFGGFGGGGYDDPGFDDLGAWNAGPAASPQTGARGPSIASLFAEMGKFARFDDLVDYATGTSDDPKPLRLGWEWLSGTGPEKRVFTTDSTFSRAFAKSPAGRFMADWANNKFEGPLPQGHLFDNLDYVFHKRNKGDILPRFLQTNDLTNHFLGSVQDTNGVRNGDVVNFTTHNEADLHSLFYGNILDKNGLGVLSSPAYPRSTFGPGGETRQVIHWSLPIGPDGRIIVPND